MNMTLACGQTLFAISEPPQTYLACHKQCYTAHGWTPCLETYRTEEEKIYGLFVGFLKKKKKENMLI